MKKLIAFMLATATISSVFSISIFAEDIEENIVQTENVQETQEIEPRESLYFSSYIYDLDESSKKGYLDFTTTVIRTDRTDKVRVSVQIQQYNDGWEDYGGEYIGTSSKTAYLFQDTVKVDRGEEYRAKFTYEAIVGGKVVETKIRTTSGIVAP